MSGSQGSGATIFLHAAATQPPARGDNAPELILALKGNRGRIEMIRLVRAEAGARARIIGFGSHVNVERLEAAKLAGCDQALARSAFVNILPRLLSPSGTGAQ